MGVLEAERIKLTSVKSPWWCSAIIVALGLGLAMLISSVASNDGSELDVWVPLVGVNQFGIMVLLILAALTMTSEYRFGIIRTTFQAVSNRALVMFTKAGVVGGYGALLIGVVTLISYGLAKGMGGDAMADATIAGNERTVFGLPLYAFLVVFLAIGVGALVRQSAAAIAILLLWPLVIENLIPVFGSFGRDLYPFMPFANMNHFLGVVSDSESELMDFSWGPWGSLVYFTVFVAIVFGSGIAVVIKRDA